MIGPSRNAAKRVRACPFCAQSLVWREARCWRGTYFDYYDPCPSCAGLVCFDRRDDTFEVLITGVPPLGTDLRVEADHNGILDPLF